MKIQIKKQLLQEGVVDHLKRNWGKYALGVGAAGSIYAAGQGAFGVEPQDEVQDWGANVANQLENRAQGNNVQGYEDAAYETYLKPDNIYGKLTDDPTFDTSPTFAYQNALQKEHQLANLQNGTANAIRSLTGTEGNPDTTNYIIRHPIDNIGLKADEYARIIKPIVT